MPSKATKKLDNVKAFVLYLMRNINYPMTFVTVNDVVMQTDYIMYIDLAEAFQEMLEGHLVKESGTDERGDTLYEVTRRGAMIAEELSRDMLPDVLDEALRCAFRYLDLKKRGVTLDCSDRRLPDGTFDVTLTMKEKGKIILCTTVNVDSEYRSRLFRQNFRDRPDVILRGVTALLSGNVDYLFDK
ncbi:MAG: DUF4364 family protein [Ruminococcaceae bacterium]|nr:DUF4364 family protein [Oscillospiraceae bacterium]